jgi:hypothetical protein
MNKQLANAHAARQIAEKASQIKEIITAYPRFFDAHHLKAIKSAERLRHKRRPSESHIIKAAAHIEIVEPHAMQIRELYQKEEQEWAKRLGNHTPKQAPSVNIFTFFRRMLD